MKTKIRNFKNQQLKLVIDEPGIDPKDCAVLAVAELYEGLGVWTVADIRLKKHAKASPHFCVGADHYWAHWTAPDMETAERARALLRETFTPVPDGGSLDIDYCTFDGLVRGKTPAEMGVAKHMRNPSALLHTRNVVNAIFASMTEFWDAFPHSESDANIWDLVERVKIENPWCQVQDVRSELKLQDLTAKANAFKDITACLCEQGWTEFGGPALATKMFDTAVGKRQATARLVDYGLNSKHFTLDGEYQSEGNNCLASHGILIPKSADSSEIRRLTTRFSENADAVISQTYAVRLLNFQSEQDGAAEPAPAP